MPTYRDKVETWFELLAETLYDRAKPVAVLMLIVTLGLGWGLAELRIDTSTRGLLHEDDPILIKYNEFLEQFGRGESLVVAVRPDDLFSLKALNRLKALHQDLAENVPHVNDQTSLLNARRTWAEGDRLEVGELLAEMPASEAEAAELKARVLNHPLYPKAIISPEGDLALILMVGNTYSSLGEPTPAGDEALEGFDQGGAADPGPGSGNEYLTEGELWEAVEAIREVLARHRQPGFELSLAGGPVVSEVLKSSMIRNIAIFICGSLLVMAGCLGFMFRRMSGVILPLLVVSAAMASTLGLMAQTGTALKVPLMILPSFLIAVGLGAAIHIMALFYRFLAELGDKRRALAKAMGHSGLAVTMTSLTTSAGVASFATAEVAPVADLGIFAGLGVLLALVYALVLLPALLSLSPLRLDLDPSGTLGHKSLDRIFDCLAELTTDRPWPVVILSLLVLGIALAGASRLYFSHDVLGWLPEELPVARATRLIDEKTGGTVILEVVLDTGRENGLYDPANLRRLDKIRADLEAWQGDNLFVGRASSVVDILKEIHQALNENRPEFFAVPDNPKLIPQEFLLFENSGSDDLENIVDSQFRVARMTIKVPWRDTLKYVPFMEDLENRFRAEFGSRAEVRVTGMMALFSRTFFACIRSAAKSYVIALGAITIMMIVLIGSFRVGLISMIPNLAPILTGLGIMGWAGIPFDISTMLIFSVAIGLAVDDTVHFMHHFRRHKTSGLSVREAVRATLETAGRAMLVTSVVLSLGFFVFMLATIRNVFYFGLLTGLSVLLALLADFLLAPALMAIVYRRDRNS